MRQTSMSEEQKQEYKRLTSEADRIAERLEVLNGLPATFGYARVSTSGQAKKGNSLDEQKAQLKAAGANNIYADVFSGAKSSRPEFDRLMLEIKSGDTLVVTKLDRLSRSLRDGSKLIRELTDKGIKVNVLNMGLLDADTPNGRLMIHMLLAFAEFERDMIEERMQEGKEAAKKKPGYREGRPRISQDRIDTALELIGEGYSYKQVAKKTGISVATIARAVRAKTIE